MGTRLALLLAFGCSAPSVVPGEPPTDAGSNDRGIAFDGGKDASTSPDSGAPDSGAVDSGASDGGASDSGDIDAGGPFGIPACRTDVSIMLGQVPGLSAGIVKNGRLACVAVMGEASIEDSRPVTPDAIFAWASVSKTVTGIAAMILYDDGAFDLDDDIDGYLPFSVRNPNCPSDPITFRQLLTHSSSIIDNEAVYDASYTMGDSTIPLGDFVRGYLAPGGEDYDEEENFDSSCPGEVNDYSNIAIGLLGHLVETIAEVPFDQFCRQRIFEPLAMDETSFHLANLDASRVAMPYDGAPPNFVAVGHIGFPTFPDGLLRTSVPHLARVLALMANGGEYGGMRILAEATVAEMSRLQIPALDDTQGLVWYYDSFGARTSVLGHDGEDPGTSSMIYFDPADGAGVLLVANGSWYDSNEDSPEADALIEALFTESESY